MKLIHRNYILALLLIFAGVLFAWSANDATISTKLPSMPTRIEPGDNIAISLEEAFDETSSSGSNRVAMHETDFIENELFDVASAEKNDVEGYDLDAIKKIDEFTVEKEIDDFFVLFLSEKSLTESEVDQFGLRLLATIEASDDAREAVARAYRNLDKDNIMVRDMFASMLMPTEAGRNILIMEADNLLATGQVDLYADAFQIYQNMGDYADPKLLDLAYTTIQSTDNLRAATAMLNYIGTIENSDLSSVYQNQALSVLGSIANEHSNPYVRSLSVQKLYRLTKPSESSVIAEHYVLAAPTAPLIIETLNSISSNDVLLTGELRSALKDVLKRSDVTPEEIEKAREIGLGDDNV